VRRLVISFLVTATLVFGVLVLILRPHSAVEWLFPAAIGAVAGIALAGLIANSWSSTPDSVGERVTPTGRLWPRTGRPGRDPAAPDVEHTPE
jgi:hypothetical protein